MKSKLRCLLLLSIGIFNQTLSAQDMSASANPIGVASGIKHTLAVCNTGVVTAVGDNTTGQLGNGTTASSYLPVLVSGLTGIVAVAAHEGNSYALKNDGTLWAWGSNINGQVGDGTNTMRTTPVQVLTGVAKVVAGHKHAVALKINGTVWTWGLNSTGQLGDGTTTNRNSPVQVTGLTGTYIDIAAGSTHSVALKSDGTVWAWGFNLFKQLGDGTINQRNSPVQAINLSGISAIASEWNHNLAIKGGSLWAWGYNGYGQLGINSINSVDPVACLGLTSGVTKIATGELHSVAMKSDGTVWSCGNNLKGQLGIGSTTEQHSFVQVGAIGGIISIATGYSSSFAIKSGGITYAWGANNNGQLGDGTANQQNSPLQVNPCSLAGIEDLSQNQNEAIVYPAVNDGSFFVMFSNAVRHCSVSVFNMVGKKIYESENRNFLKGEVVLPNASAGIYLVRIATEEGNYLKRIEKR
jgi:alpha-tubulin suppressor-like RCC1 family protein